MTNYKQRSPLSARSLVIALGVGAGLIWTQFSGDAMRSLAPSGVAGIPYSRSMLASLSDIILLGLLICLTAGIGLGRLTSLAGLTAPIIRPLLVNAVIFGLATVASAFLAPLATDLSTADIAWRGVGGPLSEEIVFRGLAVGALMCLAGWRFLPAVIAPAVIFGIAHAAQGQSLLDSASIIAITGIGGLLFGWLFVRWGFNLWPAVFAHVGMNTLWEVFALGDTALGGWFGNALRLAIIVLVVASALWLTPRAQSDH